MTLKYVHIYIYINVYDPKQTNIKWFQLSIGPMTPPRLALTLKGQVLTMGCNEDGQRGDPRGVSFDSDESGDEDDDDDEDDDSFDRENDEDRSDGSDDVEDLALATITALELPEAGLRVRQVACGANHSVLLTQCGRVFTCGSNEVLLGCISYGAGHIGLLKKRVRVAMMNRLSDLFFINYDIARADYWHRDVLIYTFIHLHTYYVHACSSMNCCE